MFRPVFQRPDGCVLKRLFGKIDIAETSRERSHNLCPLRREQRAEHMFLMVVGRFHRQCAGDISFARLTVAHRDGRSPGPTHRADFDRTDFDRQPFGVPDDLLDGLGLDNIQT